VTESPGPRVRVYVDGFNFYYASFVEGEFGRWKWLDLVAFSECLVPKMHVDHVRYFTARVKPQPSNPRAHIRQGIYLNALRTLSRLSIHTGSFSRHEVPMYLAPPPNDGEEDGIVYLRDGGPERAWVYKLEEKGSDVNLATYLLRDAFKDLYDVAVVVSDDSDLLQPVKMVQEELGKKVIVARVPRYSRRGGRKAERASVFQGKVEFIRDVRRAHLADSQLPLEIRTREGKVISRPREWGPVADRVSQPEAKRDDSRA
jgi:uncharacterized LabA/DUF88 family protein